MTSSNTPPRLILTSASPARHKILRDCGIAFETLVSAVDEEAALASARKDTAGDTDISPEQTALLLARAKAHEVASRPEATAGLVLGCDSVFEFAGTGYGKPYTAEKATERISAMSGHSGLLHTGHWLIDTSDRYRESSELRTATVHFEHLDEQEVSDYVATGEPLGVAGSFTVDGYGAPFIRGIEGEYHTVVGLSLSALRSMLAELGYSITAFWTKPR